MEWRRLQFLNHRLMDYVQLRVLLFAATVLFLGAFTKSRKATVSFVMSVCLSVHLNRTARQPLDGFS
jgi:hypothetical protein